MTRYWFSGNIEVVVCSELFRWRKIRGIKIGKWFIGAIKGEPFAVPRG